MTLFDSHCHLDFEPLASRLPATLDEAAAAGVHGFLVPGVHPAGWPAITALSASDERIFPAYGIHPQHADIVDDNILEELTVIASKAVAIGETGLDPASPVPLDCQERAFRAQLRIAAKWGLPLLIHCRGAFRRTADIISTEGGLKNGGIMHAYSGSAEMAQEFISFGLLISITGTLTWKKSVKAVRVAKMTPLEHLVLETDAPFLAPWGHPEEYNRPAWLPETAAALAAIKGVTIDEVARVTTANVRRTLKFQGVF